MLKVYLVGKEEIRKYIENLIDWKGCGYEICAQAEDGEVAFPVIRSIKPDIIISCYEMPYMDGISLAGLVKNEIPDTEIILVSASEDYEYILKCLRCGIADCVKPDIGDSELISVLYNISERIFHKKNVRNIERMYGDIVKGNHVQQKAELFKDMVTASKSTAELIETGGRIGISLSSVWYGMVLINISLKGVEGTYKKIDYAFSEIEENEQDFNVIAFDKGIEGKAYIVKAETEQELNDKLYRFTNMAKKILNSIDNISYHGGIGKGVNRLSRMPELFRDAKRSFFRSYLIDENLFLGSDGNKSDGCMANNRSHIAEIVPKHMDREKLLDFLKFGEKEETDKIVADIVDNVGSGIMDIDILRQYLIADIYITVEHFLDKINISDGDIEAPDAVPEVAQSNEGAMKYIIRIIKKAMELRENASNSRYEDIVEEAMRYIDDNYADEKLSLNVLASHVSFSPNHLSMIFSQQTGKTFIKYLTDYRMGKAKELLRYTTKRSSEICIEVGYKDPHYFSYLFKKTQGMTPTQYRGRKSNLENTANN